MTRASAWVGIVLGLIVLGTGLQDVAAARSPMWLLAGVLAGIFLLVTGVLILRGRARAQVAMSLVALGLMARHLPGYFQTYRPWPGLAIILLGSFAFGLGILGVLLDRYGASDSKASETPGRTL